MNSPLARFFPKPLPLLTGPIGQSAMAAPSSASLRDSVDTTCAPAGTADLHFTPETFSAPIFDAERFARVADQESGSYALPMLFRPGVATVFKQITMVENEPVLPVRDGSWWPRREALAREVISRIADFVLLNDGKTRGDLIVAFYREIGDLILGMRRAFRGATDDEFNAWLSDKIAQSDVLRESSPDIILESFSKEGLSDMQRLARVFPKEYLARFTRPLAVSFSNVWQHVRAIIALHDPRERIYYAEMVSRFRWPLATLNHHVKMQRFHTHTVARQPEGALFKALVQLSRGDMTEWVYRDLLRFDFLRGGLKFKNLGEPQFEKFMLSFTKQIAKEFGDNFIFENNQVVRYYEDEHGKRKLIRLDILGQLNDGSEIYPLVIELKKGAFDESVHKQCQLYLNVMRGDGTDGNRGYLLPNQKKVLVMALVTKFNRRFEEIMELGLKAGGRRSSVFVSLYTYNKPPQEFLDKAIGIQLRFSSARAVRDQARIERLNESFSRDTDWGDAEELFTAILAAQDPASDASSTDRDPQSPF